MNTQTVQLYGGHSNFRSSTVQFCPHCGIMVSVSRTGDFTCHECKNGIKVNFSLERLKVVASSIKGKNFI